MSASYRPPKVPLRHAPRTKLGCVPGVGQQVSRRRLPANASPHGARPEPPPNGPRLHALRHRPDRVPRHADSDLQQQIGRLPHPSRCRRRTGNRSSEHRKKGDVPGRQSPQLRIRRSSQTRSPPVVSDRQEFPQQEASATAGRRRLRSALRRVRPLRQVSLTATGHRSAAAAMPRRFRHRQPKRSRLLEIPTRDPAGAAGCPRQGRSVRQRQLPRLAATGSSTRDASRLRAPVPIRVPGIGAPTLAATAPIHPPRAEVRHPAAIAAGPRSTRYSVLVSSFANAFSNTPGPCAPAGCGPARAATRSSFR